MLDRKTPLPGGTVIALSSREGGAREDEYPLAVAGLALPVVNRRGGHQWIDVRVTGSAADGELIVQHQAFLAALGFGFGGVEPPGVRADPEKRFIHQVPIEIGRASCRERV